MERRRRKERSRRRRKGKGQRERAEIGRINEKKKGKEKTGNRQKTRRGDGENETNNKQLGERERRGWGKNTRDTHAHTQVTDDVSTVIHPHLLVSSTSHSLCSSSRRAFTSGDSFGSSLRSALALPKPLSNAMPTSA